MVILEVESAFNNLLNRRGGGRERLVVGPEQSRASVNRRYGAWRDGVCVSRRCARDNALGAVTAVASGTYALGRQHSRAKAALLKTARLWRADAHPKTRCWPSSSTVRCCTPSAATEAGDSHGRYALTRINTTAPRFRNRRVMTWLGRRRGRARR